MTRIKTKGQKVSALSTWYKSTDKERVADPPPPMLDRVKILGSGRLHFFEVQRSICYKIHAFKFEKFLSTSQTKY